jgi:arylsulfatase A-like enzyme
MSKFERPTPLALVWYGVSGGLCGGSLVGVGEALYVLSSSKPAEYQALLYGAVLYGLIGAGMGVGLGVLLAIAGRWLRIDAARGWVLSFFAIVSAFGFVILRYVLNKAWYAEEGVPLTTTLGIAAGLGVTSLIGIWLGSRLLARTPLRALPRPAGTVFTWGGGIVLAFLFSRAPAPGAVGQLAPHHPQDATFAQKPDVVLILIDTTRADALGVYGAPPDASPSIDAFAKDAVVFDQHITSASWTRASTASLFSSLSPSSHATETKNAALPGMVVTLAELMQSHGYATGGLPNNANVTGAQGFDQGFDWFPYEPEYPLGASESTYALSMYSVARKAWAHVDKKKRVEDYYMPAEKQFAKAEKFIDANGKDRFFLFVHLMEPHDPYFTHPYNGEAYGRAEYPNPDPTLKDHLHDLYRGEVKHADEEVGKFLAELKAKGLYDDAMVIVTADHGEEFFEHGGFWHGTTLYDEQIHVPLIVKLPHNERAGTRVPWQVRQIDVAPTIAEMAGFEPDQTWQGTNLFDDHFDEDLARMSPPPPDDDPADATAGATAPAWVAPTWANHPGSREALSEQDFEGYLLKSLRADGHKVIEARRLPAGNPRKMPDQSAFDLMADPSEQQNLATGDHVPEWKGAMNARLQTLVDDKMSKRVQAEGSAESSADCERLKQLGYMQGDCGKGDKGGDEAPKPE